MQTLTGWRHLLAAVLVLPWLCASVLGMQQVNTQNLLTRWYELGERVSYKVTATNKDRAGTTTEAATATSRVKRDDMERLFEEFEWSALVWNGMPVQIPAANQPFRQVLSLSLDYPLAAPDLSVAHPRLTGPVLDLLSVYKDARSAMQQPTLRFAGNRAVVFSRGDTTSWADGARVVLGEDSTDLEFTLDAVNLNEGTATLTVLHAPPGPNKIRVPAEWMREPVAGAANNWTQVVRAGARQFVASVGKASSQVELQMSLTNGKVFSARMEKSIDVLERECTDEALTMCGAGVRYQMLRQATIVEGP